MTRQLVILRPEPGLSETLVAARKLGLDCIAEPLFAIEPCAWDCPDPVSFDGLLIGSANAIRHGGAQLGRLRELPVCAVGKRTAEIASRAGFTVERTGSGGLQRLIDDLPQMPGQLLRLSGAERVDLVAPRGGLIEERIVYRAMPQSLSEEIRAVLTHSPVAALHSAAAAGHFATELARFAIARSDISLVVLGPRIAEAAGAGWAEIRIADTPSDGALLALAADMCQ